MTQRDYLDEAKVTWFPENKAYFWLFSPFAATLPRCCHAPERLSTKLFREFRGSVAAKSRKKFFFNSPLVPIINGTLFINNPRLLQIKERLFSNKAPLLFNNLGLFANTFGVIYFLFGEIFIPSAEKKILSGVTRSTSGVCTCRLRSMHVLPREPTRCHPLIDMNTEPQRFQRNIKVFCWKCWNLDNNFVSLQS